MASLANRGVVWWSQRVPLCGTGLQHPRKKTHHLLMLCQSDPQKRERDGGVVARCSSTVRLRCRVWFGLDSLDVAGAELRAELRAELSRRSIVDREGAKRERRDACVKTAHDDVDLDRNDGPGLLCR